MRVVCVTDLHGRLPALEAILEREKGFDLVVLGGDLTHFGTPADVEKIVEVASGAGASVLALAGNCDTAEIDRWLLERGVGLHARGRRIGGAGFFGLSAIPPWMDCMYEFPEEDLDRFLAAGYAEVEGTRPLVLIAHAPPRGTLDLTSRGLHVGSVAVRNWIERVEPDLVICGHIHEARGIDRIGKSLVVNCGKALAREYAVAELAPEARAELRRLE